MLLDLINPRPALLAAELALLFTPAVPDAVDVLETKAAAVVVFEVTAAGVEEHPVAGVIAATMLVDAATGLRATTGTVKAAKSGGDSKGSDDFFFTLIVVVPIALLTLAAAVAPVVLGTTVSIPVDNSLADAVPDVVADAAAANDDCKPATDIDAGADANIIDFATDAGNPPLTPPAPSQEVGLLVHCNTGSDGCGIAARDAASPIAVAIVVTVAVVVVVAVVLLLLLDTEVVKAERENTGSVAEPQRDRKTDGDADTGAVLRTAAAAAGGVDTGGTKGGGGCGHVMPVFLLAATAAALVVVKLPQGLCTHRVTGVVAAGVPIVVVVGLVIESGGIGFEGNGRLVIIAVVIVGTVVVEALVVMILLATGLDMDDDNSVADLGFDAVAAAFVVVPFVAIVTSAAKIAFDAVSPPAVLAAVDLVVLISADGTPDGTTAIGGGNGASDGRIRADAAVDTDPTLR